MEKQNHALTDPLAPYRVYGLDLLCIAAHYSPAFAKAFYEADNVVNAIKDWFESSKERYEFAQNEFQKITEKNKCIRRLDEMHRIVLPKEMLQLLDMHAKTPVSIEVRGNTIVITKVKPECTFCKAQNKENGELIQMGYRYVCPACAEEIYHKSQKAE